MSKVIPVFIASPGDVATERRITNEIISLVSKRLAKRYKIAFTPVDWEDFAPLSSSDGTHPQHYLLKNIETSGIFIGILHSRYGSIVPGQKQSGTEMEFNHALSNRDRIKILTYFREAKPHEDMNASDIKQLSDVNELKQRLTKENIWYYYYSNIEDFREHLIADLYDIALQIVSQPDKRITHYEKFLELGTSLDDVPASVCIIYPPIDQLSPHHGRAAIDWQQHLLPTVVFEDFKTIQKTQSILRLLGCQYKTLTVHSSELESIPPGDRFWVCIPRNRPANKVLEQLGSEVRFQFKESSSKQNEKPIRYLEWRRDKEVIRVFSPLNKYLINANRPNRKTKWLSRFGYIFARDFGILARFRINSGGQQFFHYFFGGIRGLGTWGAGWYLDHRSHELAKIVDSLSSSGDSDGNIQILLEATYCNYRMISVRDVSEQSQAFFDEQNDQEYILKQLQSYL